MSTFPVFMAQRYAQIASPFLKLLMTGLHFESGPIIKPACPSSDDIAQATSVNYKTGLDAYNSLMIIKFSLL
jgi:hypothetical protein